MPLLGVILVGGALGVGLTEGGPQALIAGAHSAAVSMQLVRVRQPQGGDYWSGCNDAREAGTAPIYRGEPGYREEMDGDRDGIACEPYR